MPFANQSGVYRPCLLLVHGDASYAAETCLHFRRQGWDVYQASDGPEARRLARMLEADLVVLEADLAGESGWLTCAKLTRERPGGRVILVSDDAGPSNYRMAHFSGAAAIVRRQDSLLAVVESLAAKRSAA
jgi:DNA-binding response OmpR family regulator